MIKAVMLQMAFHWGIRELQQKIYCRIMQTWKVQMYDIRGMLEHI